MCYNKIRRPTVQTPAARPRHCHQSKERGYLEMSLVLCHSEPPCSPVVMACRKNCASGFGSETTLPPSFRLPPPSGPACPGTSFMASSSTSSKSSSLSRKLSSLETRLHQSALQAGRVRCISSLSFLSRLMSLEL